MPEKEVCSPVLRPGSKVGSNNPSAPARAVILPVDTPTLFARGRHMEQAATARSRES